MTRRRFVFWLSFGLFNLAEALRADALDTLAAQVLGRTESLSHNPPPAGQEREPDSSDSGRPTHWTARDNTTWRWFERETWIDGHWKLTGITTPVHKQTGEPYDRSGYLDERLVPGEVRLGNQEVVENLPPKLVAEFAEHQPAERRRARHGRPPSKWLRSLRADEIGIWLKTIEVPEAGVSGMTYWTHLTRDHLFDPEKIEGLTIDEQAKLHAAAHYGY